ncbi:MAG TPA: M1 family aminopeptidase, partial [Chthonomonadales bacterium]|nr:M1 family aminopeptidase [Chthonomonadales bacterium]
GKGFMPSSDPHEWGHTWWGGFVPNTYLKDIWNESFATYSESVFARYGGAENGRELINTLNWRRPRPAFGGQPYMVPLDKTADALFGPSSESGYSKGCLVMQNLEGTLGMPELSKCMLAFRNRFDKSEEAATWSDFEEIVNKVTGKNYSWWFNEWVRRPGLPSLKLANVRESRTGSEYRVTAQIVQPAPAYRLTVPVWITTRSGDTVKKVVEVDSAATRIALTCSSAPTKLMLDPEMMVPRIISAAELGGPEFGRGKMPLVIASRSGQALANRLRNFGLQVHSDSSVRPDELKSEDIILIGAADNCPLWTRWEKWCPFQATSKAVRYHGKVYEGGNAVGSSQNPASPAHSMLWVTAGLRDPASAFQLTGNASVAVFDSSGALVDGAARIVKGGPGVYTFASR